MISMETLKSINDYKLQYFKTSMFIHVSCIIGVWFANLSEVLQYTVVILNNATTLMHKVNLSTNNFGNNHFGQKYQE